MSSRARRNRWRSEAVEFAPIEVTIEASADTGVPSFNMKAYNGGRLHLGNFRHPVVVNASGVEVHGGADTVPILRDHDGKRPVGHGKTIINDSSLEVEGTISQTTQDADEIVAAAKNGYPWQASIGGRITKPPVLVKAGQSVKVNGRSQAGPVYVVHGFAWTETSVVSIGADADRATTSIAAQAQRRNMSEFEKWLEAKGFESSELNQAQEDTLRASYEAELEANDPETKARKELDKITAESAAQQLQAEMASVSSNIFRVNKLTAQYQGRVKNAVLEPLQAQAVAGEISPTEYELELVKAARPTAVASALSPNYSGANANTITAALSMTCGLPEDTIAGHMKEEVGPEAAERAMNDAYQLKGFNLHKLVHAVLAANGHAAPLGAAMDEDILRVALGCTPANKLEAASGFSTISLPGILSRVANKAMLQSYGDFPGVATRFCSQTDASDLKEFDRYRMTEAGLLDEISDTGEIKHSHLTEEAHSNKVRTYAKMFSVSEAMFINDDLGAMLDIPRLIGRMSAQTLETHVIELLVDLTSGATEGDFFSSASTDTFAPNYFTGAGTELGLDSLGTAYKLFLDQVDSDGKPIMVNPALLLVSTKNAVNAGKLNNDTSYRLGTGTGSNELIDNQWRGMFTPLVSPHLGRLGTAPSEDQWYLLPNPSDTAVINIAYLRGQRAPTIRQADAEFNKLGVQMRGVFRFGVAAWDRRLAVKSKGAA